MSYEGDRGGRFGEDASEHGRVTFAAVEQRLVEAMIVCWRHGDREASWLHLKSGWPEVLREIAAGDWGGAGIDGHSAAPIRPASLTRIEVAEMEEAFGWLDAVSPEDRRIVGMALAQLASGKREVSWLKIMQRLGLAHGSEGLRKRYGRALTAICHALTRRNPSGSVSTG